MEEALDAVRPSRKNHVVSFADAYIQAHRKDFHEGDIGVAIEQFLLHAEAHAQWWDEIEERDLAQHTPVVVPDIRADIRSAEELLEAHRFHMRLVRSSLRTLRRMFLPIVRQEKATKDIVDQALRLIGFVEGEFNAIELGVY